MAISDEDCGHTRRHRIVWPREGPRAAPFSPDLRDFQNGSDKEKSYSSPFTLSSKSAKREQSTTFVHSPSALGLERGEPGGSGPARPVGRRLQTMLDVLADRLAVDPELAGDRGDAKTLSVKIKDHHEFPKVNHRSPLQPFEMEHR
jgi:hypothetical protein